MPVDRSGRLQVGHWGCRNRHHMWQHSNVLVWYLSLVPLAFTYSFKVCVSVCAYYRHVCEYFKQSSIDRPQMLRQEVTWRCIFNMSRASRASIFDFFLLISLTIFCFFLSPAMWDCVTQEMKLLLRLLLPVVEHQINQFLVSVLMAHRLHVW